MLLTAFHASSLDTPAEIYLCINKTLTHQQETPPSSYLGCHDCHQIKPHALNLLFLIV